LKLPLIDSNTAIDMTRRADI